MSNKVLLTGISGWIAKHIAIELLKSGYEVLGTVRDNNLIEETKKTLASQNAPLENLSFVELDLLNDAGWDEAANGCKYIINAPHFTTFYHIVENFLHFIKFHQQIEIVNDSLSLSNKISLLCNN